MVYLVMMDIDQTTFSSPDPHYAFQSKEKATAMVEKNKRYGAYVLEMKLSD